MVCTEKKPCSEWVRTICHRNRLGLFLLRYVATHASIRMCDQIWWCMSVLECSDLIFENGCLYHIWVFRILCHNVVSGIELVSSYEGGKYKAKKFILNCEPHTCWTVYVFFKISVEKYLYYLMLYILEIILLLFLSLLNQRRLIKNVLHMISSLRRQHTGH